MGGAIYKNHKQQKQIRNLPIRARVTTDAEITNTNKKRGLIPVFQID